MSKEIFLEDNARRSYFKSAIDTRNNNDSSFE